MSGVTHQTALPTETASLSEKQTAVQTQQPSEAASTNYLTTAPEMNRSGPTSGSSGSPSSSAVLSSSMALTRALSALSKPWWVPACPVCSIPPAYAMPVVTIVSMPFMPESPRWLLLQGKEQEALKSLTWIRNGAYDQLALRSEFEEMRLNALHDMEMQSKWLVLDLLRGTNLRRTLLCVGVGLINAGIGAMFVLAFGTYFFKVTGVVNPFKWIVPTQWIGVIGLFFAYYLLDRVGRRTLLLIGTTACGLSMLVLGVMFSCPSLKGTTGPLVLQPPTRPLP